MQVLSRSFQEKFGNVLRAACRSFILFSLWWSINQKSFNLFSDSRDYSFITMQPIVDPRRLVFPNVIYLSHWFPQPSHSSGPGSQIGLAWYHSYAQCVIIKDAVIASPVINWFLQLHLSGISLKDAIPSFSEGIVRVQIQWSICLPNIELTTPIWRMYWKFSSWWNSALATIYPT